MASPIHPAVCERPWLRLASSCSRSAFGSSRAACGRRARGIAADQAAELAIVFLLVFDDPLKDGQTGRIAERFELLAVFGNVAAFIDFQAAQSQIVAPDAILEAVGITGRVAPVDRFRLAQFAQAVRPQRGMLLFRSSHVFQRLLAARLSLSLGKRAIGVVAGHLRLPVLFQNLAEARVTGQCRCGLESVSKLLRCR